MSLSPRARRKLAALSDKPVNFDADALDLSHPPAGWNVDDRRSTLPSEEPGEPEPDGSFEIAQRLIRGYEFADPSMVRAHYDPDRPLAGRNMLLELRTLGFIHVYVGVRVGDVYDEVRDVDGCRARVSGWYYRTLEGHVETGQMDWQVWKWLDTGEVEFRVYAVSRTATIKNPFVRVGFWLLRDHERKIFLNSTGRRMKSFTELALQGEGGGERVRQASSDLTARRRAGDDLAHDELARSLDPD
jgi:uncharacterized protein (UPF0548 family)